MRIGYKHSEQTREKMRIVQRNKRIDPQAELVRRKKIGKTLRSKYASGELIYNNPMRGKKHSEKTLQKMRVSAKIRISNGIALPTHPGYGDKHHWWRGGIALYESRHNWVVKILGRPKICQRCGNDKNDRYEWSNKSGKYLKDVKDWERLCVSCHRKEDSNNPKRPLLTFPSNRKKVGQYKIYGQENSNNGQR